MDKRPLSSLPLPPCPHPVQPPSRAPPVSQALGYSHPRTCSRLSRSRVASPFLAVQSLSLTPSPGRPLKRTQSIPLSSTVSLSFSLRFCLRYRRSNLRSPWYRGYLLTPIRSRDRTYHLPLLIDPTTSTASVISTTTIATTTIVYYYYTGIVSPVLPLVLCHHYTPSVRGRP